MHAILYLIFNLLRSDGSRAEQDNKELLEAMDVLPNQPPTSGLQTGSFKVKGKKKRRRKEVKKTDLAALWAGRVI